VAESDSGRLELLADPYAVGQARAWLKSRLADWSADGIATVQLLVSELVTNAILHTSDVVEVTVTRVGSGITVEVADRNPSKPVVKRYEQDAATGRGLHLVDALADEWGVRGDAGHKSVWFRVIDGAPRRPSAPGNETADRPELESLPGHHNRAAAALPGPADGPEVSVCLSGLPVAVYLAAEEHHDALVREFGLLLRSSGDGADPGSEDPGAEDPKVPARLLELARRLVQQFGVGNEQRREQVEAARRAGRSTVDVIMMFPSTAANQVLAVADQLDEVDEFCRRAKLLTPPSAPTVKRFRRWYTDEVVRQIHGLPPSRWSFSDDLGER
jgi:anti-sigma regulatory factor (Ser/Thr protein kinase)